MCVGRGEGRGRGRGKGVRGIRLLAWQRMHGRVLLRSVGAWNSQLVCSTKMSTRRSKRKAATEAVATPPAKKAKTAKKATVSKAAATKEAALAAWMAKVPQGGVLVGEDGAKRCWWCGSDELYMAYHDEEWGKYDAERSDTSLFEMLTLEGAQAGLSWITVLKRRETYRRAYEGFSPAVVAQFDEKKIMELLEDPGIIRNRLKVKASVKNAQVALELVEEFGSLDAYFRSAMGGWTPDCALAQPKEELVLATTNAESDALAKDLKKRGMSFTGSTIMYAFLQACGYINDHAPSCAFR